MHITAEEMSTEKMKPERDKDNKISLNIPLYGKAEITPKSVMKGNKNSLLGNKHESDLEQSFRKLCTISKYRDEECEDSDDSSSSDEEILKKLESSLVAKCPDKIRDVKKEERKSKLRPYTVSQTISPGLQSGGIIVPPCNYVCPQTAYQIPQTVEDFETQNETITQQDVGDIIGNLTKDQFQILYNAIDMVTGQHEKEVKMDPPPAQAPRIKEVDSCNSPDSSYGTMSPVSIPPSPFSMHSPNPRVEKRLSESDSAGESELGAMEQPFGPLDITRLQPVQMTKPTLQYVRPPTRHIQNCSSVTSARTIFNSQIVMAPYFPRPLRPDSIEVNEVGLEKPAADRMRENKLLKDNIVGVEYVTAIQETKPLLNHKVSTSAEILAKKSDLRAKLIALILEGPKKRRHFYAELYVKVKLYMKDFLMDILTGKDANGQSPLYVAAISRKDDPLVARLLVDTFVQDGKKPQQEALKSIEDVEGNTILHCLASKGDSYAQVLCELLYSKAFNVNHKNAASQTALHRAVENHSKLSSLACIKQLVKHGALIRIQDLYGRTVLHLAVSYPQSDSQVLRALLMSRTAEEAVNILDNDRNTPLHIAAKRNDLPVEKQKEFISLLRLSKARHDIRNKDEKVALALVTCDRKEDLKQVLQHRKM